MSMNAHTPSFAAIYLRLSKDHKDQTSTVRQAADCREQADKDGAEVGPVFEDLVSGYRADVSRPGFDQALSWVSDAPGRTLYVWKIDRLSRRGIGQVGLVLDRLEETRSRVVFVRDGLDSSVQGHRMVIAILAEQARQESANTSTRTRSALAHRKREGLWPGGLPPFGFLIATDAPRQDVKNPDAFVVTDEAPPGRLVEDPETAPVVREMVARVIGGASLFEVSKWLGDQGITTARGAEWRVQTISTMLRSPVLVGWLPERKAATTPARDPKTREPISCGDALISLADRRRLLDALERRSKARKGGRRVSAGRKPRHLLSGLLRCAACGSAMAGGGDRYACSLKAAGGRCPGNAVSLARADEYVAARTISYWAALEPEDPVLHEVAAVLLGRPVVDPLDTAERRALEDELAEHRARLDDLVTLRLEPEFRGPEGAERYARLRDPLIEAIERAEAALREAKASEPDLGALLERETLLETWEGIPQDVKRATLAATISYIEVLKTDKRGPVWDPETRLRISWRVSEGGGKFSEPPVATRVRRACEGRANFTRPDGLG